MRELLSLTKWFLAGTFYYIKRLTNTRQCGCAVAPWGELAGFVLSDADRFVFIRFSSGTVMAKRRNSRVISASYTPKRIANPRAGSVQCSLYTRHERKLIRSGTVL